MMGDVPLPPGLEYKISYHLKYCYESSRVLTFLTCMMIGIVEIKVQFDSTEKYELRFGLMYVIINFFFR